MQKYAILMTTYNGAKCVAETVRSIGAAIQNFGHKIPFYVYDDASKDNTVEVVRSAWPLEADQLIVRVNTTNLGLYHNKNHAFSELWDKYEWIFVIHQDDLACPDWITRLDAARASHPSEKVFTVWGNYGVANPSAKEAVSTGTDRVTVYKSSPAVLAFAIQKIYTAFSISGCLIQTKLAKQMGFFDGSFAHFGDTDFLVRGFEKGFENIYVDKVIQLKKNSESQASRRHYLAGTDAIEMARFYRKHARLLTSKERGELRKTLGLFIVKRMLRFVSMGNLSGVRQLFRPLLTLFER